MTIETGEAFTDDTTVNNAPDDGQGGTGPDDSQGTGETDGDGIEDVFKEESEADGKPEGDSASSEEGGESRGGDAAATEGEGGTPDTYEAFDLPEGVTLEGEQLDAVTALFKEAGLTQEQAQRIIAFDAERSLNAAKEASELTQTNFNEMVKSWSDMSLKDEEFGGKKYQESLGIANSALKTFGTPELVTLLKNFGLAKHPEVVRVFYRAGLRLKEPTPDAPKPGGGGNPGDYVSQLYPDAN